MGHLSKNHKKMYLRIAGEISAFSYCTKKKVGSVLVKNNQIISTGYNGTVSGFDNSCEINGFKTKKEVLHSEANAIMACAREGISTNGAVLFVTLSPCVECAKLIIQAGIKRVYYTNPYKDLSGRDLLLKSNIKVSMSK